jgi:hypothetical protein
VNRATTSNLCVECGLCCDGSLFADVELANDRESILMESAGAVVDEDEDAQLLAQPCSALRGKRCSIYKQRPQCCRTFECLLLKRVQRGEISFADAREQIRFTLELKASIESFISLSPEDDPKLSFKERCQDAISADSGGSVKLEQLVGKFDAMSRQVFLGGHDVSA